MSSHPDGRAWGIRAARNQSMFRAINDKLTHDEDDPMLVIACECADLDCAERVEITRSAYERLREHPNRFAVLDGHVYPEVEDVTESNRGFVVVGKRGDAAEVAVSAAGGD